jgi:hypothetical protein
MNGACSQRCSQLAKSEDQARLARNAMARTWMPKAAPGQQEEAAAHLIRSNKGQVMRWRMITDALFIATLATGMATCAKAASMKGDFLLQQCTSNTVEGGFVCLGYVLGYVDATIVWKVNAGGTSICIPSEDVTNQQIIDIVVKWLKNHPRDLNQAAGYLLKIILEETWPCREGTLQAPANKQLSALQKRK